MKEIKTLAGTIFLLWFVGSPFLSLALFIIFNDQLRYHNFNFFWVFGVVSIFLAIIGAIIIKFSHQGVVGKPDEKTTQEQIVLWLFIIYLIFAFLLRQLWVS